MLSIKSILKRKGFSVEQIAIRIHVTKPTMYKYVDDINEMKVGKFLELCSQLNMTMEELIREAEQCD